MSASQTSLVRDWQNNLVEFARRRHYTLKTVPVIRLHSDTSLNDSELRIDAAQADASEAGQMSTQALSAAQLAAIRAQVNQNPQQSSPNLQQTGSLSAPDNTNPGASNPQQSIPPGYEQGYVQMQAPMGSGANLQPMPQAWLTIRLPQAGQQNYRIEKPVINIGRQLSNDIIVEDKRVSRYHAQIKYQDGQFAIYDLGSTNGITINNTPHMRQHTLRNGDHFTIGSYDFYFERR